MKEIERVKDKKYRTIDGRRTCNVCGMCMLPKHKGALTVRQLKQHECLKKECEAFVKFVDHPYWEQRKNNKLRARGLI